MLNNKPLNIPLYFVHVTHRYVNWYIITIIDSLVSTTE